MKTFTRTILAAGAVSLASLAPSLPANAAPLGQNLEALKSSTSQNATNVQWRRHRGVAIGLGAFGAGVVAGSIIANSNRGYYYDQPYGYYEQPYGYYSQPYGYYGYGNTGNGYAYGTDVTGGNN